MSNTILEKPKVTFEYIHSCYTEDNREGSMNDRVWVKANELTTHPDGTVTVKPVFRFHQNPQRDFWITKKVFQKHEFKLETEYLDRLNHYTTTQRDMVRQIQYKLGKPYKHGMRAVEAFRRTYVYKTDIDINSVVKIKEYKDKYKYETLSGITYAVQDIEFDMNGKLGMIIFSMSFKDKAYQVVLRDWVGEGDTPEEYVKFISEELPEIKERNIKLEIDFVTNMVDGIQRMYKKANEWMPDFIGFWNINYDMTIIENILKDAGVNPADVFSHPSVPPEYRFFHYRRGPLVKRKDDGSSRPLATSEQWHTVFTPAPYYFIDPASLYRSLRKMKAEPSYSLDNLTTKLLGKGKYHVDHPLLKGMLTGSARWHMTMQKHFKKEYCAYGLIDCIRVEQFDEETGDVQTKLPLLLGNSQIKDFNSNPRKLCDAFHTFCLDEGQVISTTSDQMKTKLDSLVVGKDLWINIVEATHLEDVGLKLVDDDMFMNSRLTLHNFDLDLISAYPMIGILLGLCRRNTVFEICKIQGIDSFKHRYICVNLTGGDANAITTCQDLFKLDGLDTLHTKFAAAHNIPVAKFGVTHHFTE